MSAIEQIQAGDWITGPTGTRWQVGDTDDRHDTILDDDQLAHLCDAAASASNASDHREGTYGPDNDAVEALEAAWISIEEVARLRALEVGAEACASVIQHGEQWDDNGH